MVRQQSRRGAPAVQPGEHRDVGAHQLGDGTVGFRAQGGVDKITLKDPRDRGHDIQVDLGHSPTGGSALHGYGCSSINLFRTETGNSQFIGKAD